MDLRSSRARGLALCAGFFFARARARILTAAPAKKIFLTAALVKKIFLAVAPTLQF
jgi:hypothetical protein